MTKVDKGILLECRIQRLVLAQGFFAERGLIPAASTDHRLLATDIDVLVSEYSSNFHLTRSHYECKSGKIRPLDRVLWLSGVRSLLQADASVLVLPQVDMEIIAFARLQNIDIMTEGELATLEESLSIEKNIWPGRSNANKYVDLRAKWSKAFGSEQESEQWSCLKAIFAFIEVDSWLYFNFRCLNALIRYVQLVSAIVKSPGDKTLAECGTYALNALTVRLAQVLLHLCREHRAISKAERKRFFEQKLTFGETNPAQAKGLIEGTLRLARETVKSQGSVLSVNIDTSKFTSPPDYSKDFIALVEHLIGHPQGTRHLVVATELELFGDRHEFAHLPALAEVVSRGEPFAAMLNGFVQRLCALTAIPRFAERVDSSVGASLK